MCLGECRIDSIKDCSNKHCEFLSNSIDNEFQLKSVCAENNAVISNQLLITYDINHYQATQYVQLLLDCQYNQCTNQYDFILLIDVINKYHNVDDLLIIAGMNDLADESEETEYVIDDLLDILEPPTKISTTKESAITTAEDQVESSTYSTITTMSRSVLILTTLLVNTDLSEIQSSSNIFPNATIPIVIDKTTMENSAQHSQVFKMMICIIIILLDTHRVFFIFV